MQTGDHSIFHNQYGISPERCIFLDITSYETYLASRIREVNLVWLALNTVCFNMGVEKM